MIFPAFLTLIALFVSFFTVANGLPTTQPSIHARALAGPKSLLGRYYLAHKAATGSSASVISDDDFAQTGPIGRADRFHAVQRRLARRDLSGDQRAHQAPDNELLSNHTVNAPVTSAAPPASTQVQAPLAAPNTSITLIPRPTTTPHVVKHRKDAGRKTTNKKKSTV